MKAIRDLKKIIAPSSKIRQGVVVQRNQNSIILSSSEGRTELYVATPSQFLLGDFVRFKDGVVLGVSSSEENLTVYQV